MKKFLLSLAVISGFGIANAAEESVAFVAEGASYTGTAKTITLPEGTLSNEYSLDGVVTLSWENAGTATQVTSKLLRWYANSTMTVKPNDGITITKLEVEASTAAYAKDLGSTCSTGTITYSSGTTVTWTGEEKEAFTIKAEKQCRVKYIVITYEKSDIAKKPAGLEFSESSVMATKGTEFIAPVLTKMTTASVLYSSSNEDVATVDSTSGVITLIGGGITTIIAESAENEDFYKGYAEYELIVVDPDQTYALIDYNKLGYINQQQIGKVDMGIVSATADKGTNTNTAPQYLTASNAVRFYTGNTYTVNVIGGYYITKITIEGTFEGTPDKGTYSNNIWTPNAGDKLSTVTFKTTTNKKEIKTVKVEWANDNPTSVDTINIDANATKEYYNLQGVRVANPEKGLYIVRQGGKTSKVIL